MSHPHAKLMLEYAIDAQTHDKPWELWQCIIPDGKWEDLNNYPMWDTKTNYRRKPHTQKIKFNVMASCDLYAFTPEEASEKFRKLVEEGALVLVKDKDGFLFSYLGGDFK